MSFAGRSLHAGCMDVPSGIATVVEHSTAPLVFLKVQEFVLRASERLQIAMSCSLLGCWICTYFLFVCGCKV